MSANRLDPGRTAILFFDCLKGYLRPEDAAARAAIDDSGVIPSMVRMAEACRALGVPIFFTRVDHRLDLGDIAPLIADLDSDGRRPKGSTVLRSTLATPGTWKNEIIDELGPGPQDYVIRKQRWSAFFETNFWLHLRRLGVDTIMFAGGNTEIGVASTAYAARDRDYNTVFLSDACRSRRDGLSDFFMDRVFPIFGRVRTVDEAIAMLHESEGVVARG